MISISSSVKTAQPAELTLLQYFLVSMKKKECPHKVFRGKGSSLSVCLSVNGKNWNVYVWKYLSLTW